MRRHCLGIELFLVMVLCVSVHPGFAMDGIRINEFMASNQGAVQDAYGDYDDWIELYNDSDHVIDLGEFYLTDDLSKPAPWQFPENTVIEAYGYLMVWADNQPQQGALHLDFKLKGSGEEISLLDYEKTPVDQVIFGAQDADRSYGRVPDGRGPWQVMAQATPGSANLADMASVKISEIMYHPYHAPGHPEDLRAEYIELVNWGEEPVDLTGWSVSRGVAFDFPSMTLAPGAYLVVAADVSVCQALHPDVTHVVGNWLGHLSNRGEAVELMDAPGRVANRVDYADQGDWSQRELGPSDYGHRGWQWRDDHDGQGKSLELINVALSNACGQNWAASLVDGGTPGRVNSVTASDIAPMIQKVSHWPMIPGPADEVSVNVTVTDEQAEGVRVFVKYRVDAFGTNEFQAVEMFDQGTSGDVLRGDRIYGAVLPAQADQTIVEFYIEAADAMTQTRTWPAPVWVDGQVGQSANALYQVDSTFDMNQPWQPGTQPIYRLIMTETERADLARIGSNSSDGSSRAQKNGTFISVDGVSMDLRYGVGIRNRGAGSRSNNSNNYRNNYRVNFLDDHPWQGITALNIKNRFGYAQTLGAAIWRKAGLAAADTHAIQVRVNGANLAQTNDHMYGAYVAVEVMNSDFTSHQFPEDGQGNVYRSINPLSDLGYVGADPVRYQSRYQKMTHSSVADFNDLVLLTDVLNNTPPEDFLDQVQTVIDLNQWLRFLAVDSLAGNREGGLNTPRGDDYAMYRGMIDTRFRLLPYDLDTILGLGDHSRDINRDIFGYAGLDGLHELLNHPEIQRLYYRQFLDLIQTVFSPEQFNPLVDEILGGWVPDAEMTQIKEFVVLRNAAVLAQIPTAFTIETDLDMAGDYLRSEGQNVRVSGTADATWVRSVQVQDQTSPCLASTGVWSLRRVTLQPGLNRLTVTAFDGDQGQGKGVQQGTLDIWYDTGLLNDVGPDAFLLQDTVWTADQGPYRILGDLKVPEGTTLTIEPGTSVFFESEAQMTIRGCLQAQGTEDAMIRFTRTPGTDHTWGGLQFQGSQENNLVSFAVLEYGRTHNGMVGVEGSQLTLDHVTFDHTDLRRIRTIDTSLMVSHCVFEDIFDADQAPTTDNMSEHIWGHGVPDYGWFVIKDSLFGVVKGHNDAIDFDGPTRPLPIPQILNNTFLGGGDDALDLESDAHIEGNHFSNFVKDRYNGASGESNVMSAGHGQHYVMVRNVFENIQHVVQVKDGAFLTFVNNTVVNASEAAIYFELGLPGRSPGRGAYVDGSIFWRTPEVFAGVGEITELTVNRCLIPDPWHGYGQGNMEANPLFVDPDGDYHVRPGSAALGTGPWGLDMGAFVPRGAALEGLPNMVTDQTQATVFVGGPGIGQYQFSVEGVEGPWSEVRPVDQPIALTGLQQGQSYGLYVLGQDSAGQWQDQPTVSDIWRVDTTWAALRINEVWAAQNAFELHYTGRRALDLAGMSLKHDPNGPVMFQFGPGMVIQPGEIRAWSIPEDVGFTLNPQGDTFWLCDAEGGCVDQVTFGSQLPDRSVGRVGAKGQWTLTVPTLGQANLAQPLGDPRGLKINEWFADGFMLLEDDFVELYNPEPWPVDVGGLTLTDSLQALSETHIIQPLSFVPGMGHTAFSADGRSRPGHLSFKLSPKVECLALWDGTAVIDSVFYGPQTTDVAQGRQPNGAVSVSFLALPTPDMANPDDSIRTWVTPLVSGLRIIELMYHAQGGGAYDYLRLKNISDTPLDLTGIRLTDGVDFVFPAYTLDPGAGVAVVSDLIAFQAKYGSDRPVAGVYTGSLSNQGERLVLTLPWPWQVAIQRFDYQGHWYALADGGGKSLAVVDPTVPLFLWNDPSTWFASEHF